MRLCFLVLNAMNECPPNLFFPFLFTRNLVKVTQTKADKSRHATVSFIFVALLCLLFWLFFSLFFRLNYGQITCGLSKKKWKKLFQTRLDSIILQKRWPQRAARPAPAALAPPAARALVAPLAAAVGSVDQQQDTQSFQIQDLVNCLLCHLSWRLWLKALMSSLHPRRTSLKSQRRLLAVLDFASRLLPLEACWAQPLRLGTLHKWRHHFANFWPFNPFKLNNFFTKDQVRDVGCGWAGWAIAHSGFGRSVNSI